MWECSNKEMMKQAHIRQTEDMGNLQRRKGLPG
jgi:hypothetical protein